ncbi:chloride channel protein [Gimesia sp.]|uniref:chloride channel protein n=1 Tax=Gimesia sp. TaxID=2024833 RepID=UPI0032EFD98A
MTEHESTQSPTTEGLTVSPSLDFVAEAAQIPPETTPINVRTLRICSLAIVLGAVAAFVALCLTSLIGCITNLSFYGKLSTSFISPAPAVQYLGLWVVFIPVAGALIVGLMARYGSKGIRGHGIPEAMEQVLTNESRIPMRLMFLKPLSAAVSIGTGGPFGAEGPIIATGGALGSVIGQFLESTATERKTLLAAGAAAGMAATFGSPVSAVLLAVELLLFEFRPRSIIPVALASSTATGMRIMLEGAEPVFQMTDIQAPGGAALISYILIGAGLGLFAVIITRAVYAIEDSFERLPIHWMWWPAIGAFAVGIVGYFAPDTLGVGYYNISDMLSNNLTVPTILFLCIMKFISWSISLGSGTSGGTLAPLFTIGGGIGAVLGTAFNAAIPGVGVDVRIAALVGMAAIFAGASRAMLTSVVFAFETTLQPLGLLPLLGGCAAAHLVSSFLMRNSIMTEKIARRGIRTPEDYEADLLEQVHVSSIMTKDVVTLQSNNKIADVQEWLATRSNHTSHQGFPVVDDHGVTVGVLTQRDVLTADASSDRTLDKIINRPPLFVYDDCTVRQATDHMVNHEVGRLPVIQRSKNGELVGIITRSDILSVFYRRVNDTQLQQPIWRSGAQDRLR